MEESTIIWLVVLFIYGLPLYKWRYEWRTAVYRDDHWTINIKPWFIKDAQALFTNKYFKDDELKMAWRFRIYLLIYLILFLVFLNT